MREIKFRAWSKVLLHMYYPEDNVKEPNLWNLKDNVSGGKLIEKDYILMQYTGLKDKNGKEIYEGDVLTILAEDDKINKLVVKYGIARREMKSGWTVDIPCFYFDLVGVNFKAFPIVKNYKGKHDLTMLEVIGNIYENPGLLTKGE